MYVHVYSSVYETIVTISTHSVLFMRQSLLCLRILFCLWDNLRNRFVWGQSLPCLHIFYVYETMATISRFSVLFEETHWKVYVIALSEDKRYHVYAHSSVYETVVFRRPRIFFCLKTMASMSKLTPMFENNRKHVHEHPQEFLQRGANPGSSLYTVQGLNGISV